MKSGKQRSINILISICVLSILSLFFGSNAFSAMSSSLPDSYGSASHQTQRWQRLQTSRYNKTGVSWSTDGVSWGHEDLYVGQNVQFKFNIYKRTTGTHYADFLKAWVDWNKDGTFYEANDSEKIVYGERDIRRQTDINGPGGLYNYNNIDSKHYSYTSQAYTLTDDHVGTLNLRARVTCSESLIGEYYADEGLNTSGSPLNYNTGYVPVTADNANRSSWNSQWWWGANADKEGKAGYDYYKTYENMFASTGHYNQGELEEWKLTVNANPVPEPNTILLFGIGLLGLAGVNRKQNKK